MRRPPSRDREAGRTQRAMSRDDLIDQAVPIRTEDLPIVEGIVPYMRQRFGLDGEITVQRFPGGRANLTYLVSSEGDEFVVRRPPLGDIPDKAHDMQREYRALRALSSAVGFVPRPLDLCTDGSIAGADFFVMERVRGLVVRDRWPTGLPNAPELRRRMAETYLSTLVALHSVPYDDIGLAEFGRPAGFVERQINGWERRWHVASDRDGVPVEDLFDWLRAQTLPTQPPTLIHNDFKLDNIMFSVDDPAKVVAVLDWDMATVGDPLVDVGTSLVYWAERDDSPGRHGGALPPTALPGFPDREWFIDVYADATGRNLSSIRFYEVFGLVKIAVICQQLYRRYLDGGTYDERLSVYEDQVPAMLQAARELVDV